MGTTDPDQPRRYKYMFCRDCGYDIRHLEQARCPECGTTFDPHDHATFVAFPQSRPNAGHEPIAGAAVGFFCVLLSLVVDPVFVCVSVWAVPLGFLIGYGVRSARYHEARNGD